jgi:hypothetical protein
MGETIVSMLWVQTALESALKRVEHNHHYLGFIGQSG